MEDRLTGSGLVRVEREHVAPPGRVLRAFGAVGEPVRLVEGKGGAWRVGDVVVKPSEGDVEVRWRAEVLGALPESGQFRVARPVRADGGDWVAWGWEATRLVAGEADRKRVGDVLRVGEAFHAAVRGVPRPSFLDDRTDPWANGERAAWEERPGVRRPGRLLDELVGVRRPVRVREQVVHADLLGNVLFAEGMAPAIIDWAVYWRPPVWASAVAVVDAMVWQGFGFELAERHEPGRHEPGRHEPGRHEPEPCRGQWAQMLVRAAIFRLATWDVAGWAAEPEEAYEAVTRDIVAYAKKEIS